MKGKGDRGTLLGGTGTVVALVVVLGVAGSITSATAIGLSPATDDYRPADASAAVDSVVETAMLGTSGIIGVPKRDRGNSGNGNSASGENEGASQKTDSPRRGGKSTGGAADAAPEKGGSSGGSGDAATNGESADGNDAPGKSGESKSDNAPGKGDNAPGKGDNAPGKNGTTPGESAENRTADDRRGPPETVPAAVNVSTRGNGDGRPETVVNASVGDVRANERARIGLEARRDALVNRSNASDVAVAAMELTPTRNGSFTLNVTAAERIEGSPEFATDDGTEAMSHIRVNHSITNEEVNGTVDIDFRVSTERLENESVAPEDVALYRYENGSWTELPTTVVNETGTAVLFRAESPGLSEFAAGAKRARFSVETVDVAVEEIVVGEDLQVHVTIANDGGADGEFAAQLLLNGDVVEERSLTIAAGGERQTLFDHRFDDSGEYEVRVNDIVAGTVVVQRTVDDSSTATTRERAETTADSTESASSVTADPSTTVSGTEVPEPLFHPTALVFVVVAALLARVRRRV